MIRYLTAVLLITGLIQSSGTCAQDMSGLRMGMTRAEVEAVTGPLEPDDTSFLRNAFTAQRLPGETANPLFSFAERNVYFDDEGRLWRIRLRIHNAEGALFAPDAAMGFYRSLSTRLETAHRLVNSREPQPMQRPGGDCELPAAAAKDDGAKRSESAVKKNGKRQAKAPAAATRKAAAPPRNAAPAVVRQIACGVLTTWSRTFVASGGVAHDVALRDGTLTASPVIYHLYRIEGNDPQNLSMYQRLRRKQD